MNIRYFSDLHLEFWKQLPPPEVFFPLYKDDVYIFAGDIHIGTAAISWFETFADKVGHIFYVLGNHEYYHQDFKTLPQQVKTAIRYSKADNISLLEAAHYPSVVVIDEVEFTGSTVWTNYGEDPYKEAAISGLLSDFKLIKNYSIAQVKEQYYAAKSAIIDFLSDGSRRKKVVISHHSPSFELAWKSKAYSIGPITGAFHSTILDDVSVQISPAAWFYGHTHENLTLDTLGGTKVLTNQYGYANYNTVAGFDEDAVFQI